MTLKEQHEALTAAPKCHCGAIARWTFGGQPLCNRHMENAFPYCDSCGKVRNHCNCSEKKP